ncbi:pantoate kinase [Staphylothermus hellenicus]|uniref:Pantoate kinase n=1 Tax=Staphylothermus hellenicus (strain DSM 12710 / JCM 10830 / BK20S6-10-b1 / P8) TaxID=591019 RepID=D7D8S6_STAHD|nr:hypothetical protein [Staphylothermus hellenicus]ADI32172.1 kinase (sugar kinase superfamily)-like protein [Staphylothermus hellenicus DSM 12710]
MLIKIPLHISGLWYPIITNNPLTTGSIGAGINIALYLTAKLRNTEKCGIILNNEEVLKDHSQTICGKLGANLYVDEKSPISLGYGFGVSAACLLGLSLSSLLIKNNTIEKATWPAHIAEVIYNTGYGDVIAEFYGGVEIRVKPGPPGIGVVEHIYPGRKIDLIVSILPGREDTPKMLKRISRETYDLAKKLVEELLEKPSVEEFFEKARIFTSKIFSYDSIDELLSPYRSKIIGYFRKKQALTLWVEKEWLDEIYSYLNKYFLTFKTWIDMYGVRFENPP